jgi:hypothetical protein
MKVGRLGTGSAIMQNNIDASYYHERLLGSEIKSSSPVVSDEPEQRQVIEELPDVEVRQGGVHKRVFYTKYSGYVIAARDGSEGRDAAQEHKAFFYANSWFKFNKGVLQSNKISTQIRITQEDIKNDPQLRSFLEKNSELRNRIYKFQLKNEFNVPYQDLHKYAEEVRLNTNLSNKEKGDIAKGLLVGVFSLMRDMWTMDMGHSDFHANNMKVSFENPDKFNAKNVHSVLLLDMGRISCKEPNKTDPKHKLSTARFALLEGGSFFGVGAKKKWQLTCERILAAFIEFFGGDAQQSRERQARNMFIADIYAMVSGDHKEGYDEYLKYKQVFHDYFKQLTIIASNTMLSEEEARFRYETVFTQLTHHCQAHIEEIVAL